MSPPGLRRRDPTAATNVMSYLGLSPPRRAKGQNPEGKYRLGIEPGTSHIFGCCSIWSSKGPGPQQTDMQLFWCVPISAVYLKDFLSNLFPDFVFSSGTTNWSKFKFGPHLFWLNFCKTKDIPVNLSCSMCLRISINESCQMAKFARSWDHNIMQIHPARLQDISFWLTRKLTNQLPSRKWWYELWVA